MFTTKDTKFKNFDVLNLRVLRDLRGKTNLMLA